MGFISHWNVERFILYKCVSTQNKGQPESEEKQKIDFRIPLCQFQVLTVVWDNVCSYRKISDEWLYKLFLTLNHQIEFVDSRQWSQCEARQILSHC